MELLKKFLKGIFILAFWITVWQIAALIINQELLIASPIATFKAFLRMSSTSQFYIAVLYSLIRILIGYLGGVICGVIGAVLSNHFSLFGDLVKPVLKLIKAIPVASFIILAFFWFESDYLPIFISFLMVLPMIWEIVQNELENINPKYIELANIYKLNPIKILFNIKIPFILPSFISAALTALGFAWKSGIAAEVICRPIASLGNLLQESKLYIATDEVFAITAVVAILSVSLELIIKKILRRYAHDKY